MVHNSLAFQKLYDRYSRYFIRHFCAARKEGHNRKHAFALARIKLQDLVIAELSKHKKRSDMIIRAYSNTKQDQQLYEKAIAYFKKYNSPEIGKD
jgi:hypothetical protein